MPQVEEEIRAELQHQLLLALLRRPVQRYLHVAIDIVLISAGVFLQRQRRLRVLDALGLSLLLGFLRYVLDGLHGLEQFGTPVARRGLEILVDDAVHEGAGQRVAGAVGENDQSQLLLRDHCQLRDHAVDAAAVLHEQFAAVILQHQLGDGSFGAHDRLRHVHLLDRPGAEQPLFVVSAFAQLQPQPLSHVHDVGVDRAGRPDVVDVPPGDDLHFLFDLLVRRGDVLRQAELRHTGVALIHAKRLEDAVADELIPRFLGDGRDGLRGGQVHHVLVAKLAAEAPVGFDLPNLLQHFGPAAA